MTSDLSIIVYSFSILGFLELIKIIRLIKYEQLLINSFMVLSLSLSLISFVSFPWVHPYDQKSKNIKKMSEKPDGGLCMWKGCERLGKAPYDSIWNLY